MPHIESRWTQPPQPPAPHTPCISKRVTLLSSVLSAYRKARTAPKLIALLAALALAPTLAAQQQIHVSAAADLRPVFELLAPQFEQATHIRLLISYGSSSELATQILNGAPSDIFFSADFFYPEKLVAAKLTDSLNPTEYASGTLVLWAPKNSPLQPLSLDKVTDARVKHIAIANPDHAPYGRAAVEALKTMKVYPQVVTNFVIAENVNQAAQFAESGNAGLAVISQTLAITPRMQATGTFLPFEPHSYTGIHQFAVIMSKSKHRDEAHRFLDFILSTEVQSQLPKLGLTPIK